MRETVAVSVGQCGNALGSAFWSNLLYEHSEAALLNEMDELALSAFFRFPRTRRGQENSLTRGMKARALLVDMECGPLQEMMRSDLGPLFDETQYVMDVYGAGNNFAQGHYLFGPKYRESFEESLRRIVEECESLQTYLVTHSLGGGTGSGVGTYMLSLLADLYPKVCRFSTCVYPSEDNDVVTSPYNTILASRELIEHADCVFPLDNTALFGFAKAEKESFSQANQHSDMMASQRAKQGGVVGTFGTADLNRGGSSMAQKEQAAAARSRDRGFNDINEIGARMLCHLTSSSRFHGEMNVDLNEIYTNLVPYPNMHFLMTALSMRSPINTLSVSVSAANLSSKSRGRTTLRSSVASASSGSTGGKRSVNGSTGANAGANAGATAGATAGAGASAAVKTSGGGRIALQRAFADVLTVKGQITAANPITKPGSISHDDKHSGSGGSGSSGAVTLASAFLARGRPDVLPLSDFISCVGNAQKSLRFPYWNKDACKIGICSTPAPGDMMSLLAVYNSTAFSSVLARELAGFQRLYRKKAMLHHYTEYTDVENVAIAEQTTAQLMHDYATLEQHTVEQAPHGGGIGGALLGARAAAPWGADGGVKGPRGHRPAVPSAFYNVRAATQPVQLFPAF